MMPSDLMQDRLFEWYQTASDEDKKLLDKVEDFEPLFEDMLFRKGTSTYDFVTCQVKNPGSDEWVETDDFLICDEIEYFSLSFFTYHVREIEGGFNGGFNKKDFSLSVTPGSLNDNSVIVHEMIHLHESVINELPLFFHDAIIFCLYKDLSEKIPDLDERISSQGHILVSHQLAKIGGVHDILFLLKSFDLDLKLGYPLGTVFGYGMAKG